MLEPPALERSALKSLRSPRHLSHSQGISSLLFLGQYAHEHGSTEAHVQWTKDFELGDESDTFSGRSILIGELVKEHKHFNPLTRSEPIFQLAKGLKEGRVVCLKNKGGFGHAWQP